MISGLSGSWQTHHTGFDVDWGATTVRLMPYADTPAPAPTRQDLHWGKDWGVYVGVACLLD